MKSDLLMDFSLDKENNKIKVEREFAAPLQKVWAAWTQSEILDQWWAPQPWKARTKEMDFREGGHWLYSMVGPEGETHWSRADYKKIMPSKGFTAADAFCDSAGTINNSMPQSQWDTNFSDQDDRTLVSILITFGNAENLEGYMKSGFQEGFTKGLENLDAYLQK